MRIAIATGTRADWGLLSPLARALASRTDRRVEILATNMHLSPLYGDTIREIEADGFTSAITRVQMPPATDTSCEAVHAMASCMTGMADALRTLAPDIVIILGDRFEMLATATASLMMRIPIVHIAGGEISEGAIDDSIRHAITKMASLHLTATEEYRNRVIAMGEQPDRVICTGAIGVYNILHTPLLSRRQLSDSVGLPFRPGTLLVTYHPATLDDGDVATRCRDLLTALDTFPQSDILFTYPNNDPRGRVIIDLIEQYARNNPNRVRVVPSLGKLRYLSALRQVSAVVGNSSSGIVEVPSMGIPTVDIGVRQQGRLCSESVIHCGDSAPEIARAIALALSPDGQLKARTAPNPYARPDTLSLMVDAITSASPAALATKKFHDVS